MRIVFALLVTTASAFAPIQTSTRSTTTELAAVNRRDVLAGIAGATVAIFAPQAASAVSHGAQNRKGSHTHGSTWFFDDQIENVYEESQQPTEGGKLDINAAFLVSFWADRFYVLLSPYLFTFYVDSNSAHNIYIAFLCLAGI